MAADLQFSEADHWIMRQLVRALEGEMQPAQAVQMLKTFVYFRTKAQIYFREGADLYREKDFFEVPRPEWTADELAGIERGFRQVVDWKGLIAARPLEGVDLVDLYRMIEVTHFRLEQLSVIAPEGGKRIVDLALLHRVDRRSLKLRYAIDGPEQQASSNGRQFRPSWLEGWLLRFARSNAAPPVRAPLDPTFGYTPDNPIRCFEPDGELTYICSLRCPNGHRFRGSRLCSYQGKCADPTTHEHLVPPDGPDDTSCIVDKYVLECDGGEHTCALYLDMYHPLALGEPAPVGLTRSTVEES